MKKEKMTRPDRRPRVARPITAVESRTFWRRVGFTAGLLAVLTFPLSSVVSVDPPHDAAAVDLQLDCHLEDPAHMVVCLLDTVAEGILHHAGRLLSIVGIEPEVSLVERSTGDCIDPEDAEDPDEATCYHHLGGVHRSPKTPWPLGAGLPIGGTGNLYHNGVLVDSCTIEWSGDLRQDVCQTTIPAFTADSDECHWFRAETVLVTGQVVDATAERPEWACEDVDLEQYNMMAVKGLAL